MFLISMAPCPHSSVSKELMHSTILKPQKPLGSWNLVNPLLRTNEAWTDECAARLQPLADQYKTPTTVNFRNKKFDRNNPIMSRGQKYLFLKRIHSLKYLRSTTLGCKDIGIRKPAFVALTQFVNYILSDFKVFLNRIGVIMSIIQTRCYVTLFYTLDGKF